jgi:predicted GNAT family N-acyltransferase
MNISSIEYESELELRNEILRKPIGLDLYAEDLSKEGNDFHIGAFKNDELVGCLVLTPLGNKEVKMRQVAVKEIFQCLGIGKKMVEFSEAISQENNYNKIILNARKTAVPFYERLNYKIIGDEFIEVCIPHNKMFKILP